MSLGIGHLGVPDGCSGAVGGISGQPGKQAEESIDNGAPPRAGIYVQLSNDISSRHIDGGRTGDAQIGNQRISDRGGGIDTFNVTQTAAITLPTGATVSNIENVNLLSGAEISISTTTGFSGLTALRATSVSGANGTALTAAATTDITSVVTALQASGTSQLIINGGKNVAVTATGTVTQATALTVTTGVNAEILVGATTAAAGTVNVTNSFRGVDTEVSGDVFVKGGTAVTVTQATTNTTVNQTNIQGQVSVVGTAITTAVTVNQNATAVASATGTGVVGKTAGAVTVTDVNAASTTAAGAIATVSLSSAGAAVINSGALTTLNLAGTLTTVDAGTLGALTTAANSTLALGLTGAVSSGAVTIDADIKTLNVSGNTTASTIASLVSSATAINVSGDARVTFTGNTTASVTDIVVTNTGGAVFGTALGTAVNFTGGAGTDSILLTAGFTKAITMGAGNDTVTYAAQGTGGSVAAGDGTDIIIMSSAQADSGSGVSSSSAFNTKFTGFDTLRVSNALAHATDLDGVNAATTVILAAGANGGTINNLVSGGTVDIRAANAGTLAVGVKSALVGATDVLNLQLKNTSATAFNAITAANVETINIAVADAAAAPTPATAAVLHSLTLAATSATSVVVTGNNGLTLTNTGNAAITNFDASGVVANDSAASAGFAATTDSATNLAVTFASANVTASANVSITGGAGADILVGTVAKDTIIGNAGNDRMYGDNAGTKEVQTVQVTGATDTNAGAIVIAGISTAFVAGASVAATAILISAAVNLNAALGGIVVATVATDTVTLTFLVDGNQTAATTSGTGLTSTIAEPTPGTAGTVAVDSINGGAGADLIVGGGGADVLTGGTGVDTFFMLQAHSVLATLATITDFTFAVGGASNDRLMLGNVTTVIGTTATVQDLSASASLAAAMGAAALTNLQDVGLSVFIFGGDTYAFVETTGATTTAVASDFVVKLTGLPLAAGATIAGSGFDLV